MELALKHKISHNFVAPNGDAIYALAYDVEELKEYLHDVSMLDMAKQFFDEEPKGHMYRRFMIYCRDISPEIDKIMLGFQVRDIGNMDESMRCKHFNYYPGRKGLVETHEMSYPEAGFGIPDFETNPDFIAAFRQSYRTLAMLNGASKEQIERWL